MFNLFKAIKSLQNHISQFYDPSPIELLEISKTMHNNCNLDEIKSRTSETSAIRNENSTP